MTKMHFQTELPTGVSISLEVTGADAEAVRVAMNDALYNLHCPISVDDNTSKEDFVPLNDCVALPEPPATPKSMFERQWEAGLAAIEAHRYDVAVQCFSVAASLRPQDKDVRELLTYARVARSTGGGEPSKARRGRPRKSVPAGGSHPPEAKRATEAGGVPGGGE